MMVVLKRCCCAGTDHALMLTHGGQVMSWGTAGQGQLGRIGVRHLSRDDKVRCYYTATAILPHVIANLFAISRA